MHRLMGNAVQLNEEQIVDEGGDILADHENERRCPSGGA
jgi:hypothetical protein